MKPLKGKIAVVAGATRGAGRGIACMLGEAGATVYCTGRSIRGKPSNLNRLETIEETAEMVTKYGGVGIWAQVDHTVEEQVKTFFERVKSEQGGLDILVNDVWGGDTLTEWHKPFWDLTIEKGRLMLDRAVNAHIVTSRYGVPLMFESNQGLIIEITDGDEIMNRHYRGNMFYDLAKISAMRLAFGIAQELRDYNITALAVTPGFLRSEMMLEHFGVSEKNWQDAAKKDRYFSESETPFYVGRAVAALAADPLVWKKSGRTFSSWQLAEEYGFSDIDGRKPHFGRLMNKEFEKCWLELTQCVRIEFENHKLTAETILHHDREKLSLRARLSSDEPAEWFVYILTFHEIALGDLKEIAKKFYRQFKRRR